jgi:DNA replication and repair protein RecF
MSLTELRVTNLRCIESAELQLDPDLNLITGENGAGKTSILEAIYLLGRGRSFRTRTNERLVRYGQDALTVFGRTDDEPAKRAGIEVPRDGATRARIDGRDVSTLLELSGVSAVQAIDPEIHKLIEQGPERRRRWLDWLVFHVEPNFGDHWARYQRALKQRNAALKAGTRDFSVWDAALIEHGGAISVVRRQAIERLGPYLDGLLSRFSGLTVDIGFHAGWAQDHSLAEALKLAADRDRERGTTTAGPHRADVPLRIKNRLAREILSRGQQKLTAVAMIVAQIQLLKKETGARITLLLDDPAAELDAKNLQRLFEELAALECQMIATSLSAEIPFFQAPKAMFHVEQGRVLRL